MIYSLWYIVGLQKLFGIIFNTIILIYSGCAHRTTRRLMEPMWQDSLLTQLDFRFCLMDRILQEDILWFKNLPRLRKI